MNTSHRFFALGLLVLLMSYVFAPALAAGAAPRLAPSGDLNVVGVVTVDGMRAESGQTFFSGSTVETAEGALSAISLGSLGRVELAAESGLRLGFTDAGLNGVLTAGRVRVSMPAGVSARVVTAWGEVLADPGQASLFSIDLRRGETVVSVQSGRAVLRTKGEARLVGAGESASSGAGGAQTQAGGRQNLSGGKKKGLFLALAGGIVAILIFVLTGKDENTVAVSPCNSPIILSGSRGGPCG